MTNDNKNYNNNFNPLSPINSIHGTHLDDSRDLSETISQIKLKNEKAESDGFDKKRANVLTPGSNISRVRIMSQSSSSKMKDMGEHDQHVMFIDNKEDLENNLKKLKSQSKNDSNVNKSSIINSNLFTPKNELEGDDENNKTKSE